MQKSQLAITESNLNPLCCIISLTPNLVIKSKKKVLKSDIITIISNISLLLLISLQILLRGKGA